MSNIKEFLLEVAEEQEAGLEQWGEHQTTHFGHPNPNCDYCVQDADLPEEDL